ncbi:MAG: hypothetical protein M1353_08850 [Nitrospirae bacterium]|nr:hypothetical protein [Nitrospirota bacterium]
MRAPLKACRLKFLPAAWRRFYLVPELTCAGQELLKNLLEAAGPWVAGASAMLSVPDISDAALEVREAWVFSALSIPRARLYERKKIPVF